MWACQQHLYEHILPKLVRLCLNISFSTLCESCQFELLPPYRLAQCKVIILGLWGVQSRERPTRATNSDPAPSTWDLTVFVKKRRSTRLLNPSIWMHSANSKKTALDPNKLSSLFSHGIRSVWSSPPLQIVYVFKVDLTRVLEIKKIIKSHSY